jgi:hypothetical protein
LHGVPQNGINALLALRASDADGEAKRGEYK